MTSAKDLMIYFQNMMHDGIHLASSTGIGDSVDLVCIKGTVLCSF